jgi:hypothetical protein
MSCKWVKQQGPAKGFNFDKSKVEQIFDLLLRECVVSQDPMTGVDRQHESQEA